MPSKFTRKPRAPRKKKVARARRALKINNLEIVHQTIKTNSVVNPSQGTAISNYVYWMNSASPYLSGGQSVSNSLIQTPEFALYRQMYDQFRVHSVNIKVIPRANFTEQNALVALSANTTLGRNVFYSVEDRDGIAPSSIAALKKYSSVKTHRCDKSMSRTYNVKYSGDGWFDCQKPQFQMEIQTNLGLDGGITFYGESLMETLNQQTNPIWADMEVTYQLSFRGKALVSIVVGKDGEVTMSQIPVGILEDPQVFLSMDDVPHLGAIDLVGDQIVA